MRFVAAWATVGPSASRCAKRIALLEQVVVGAATRLTTPQRSSVAAS